MEEVLNKKEALFMLSESHDLDKAFELFKISYREEKWDKADAIADYIYEKSNRLYQQQIFGIAVHQPQAVDIPLSRPLVFYYAYSYLAKALVFQKKGVYEQSKKYIARYSDMSWFQGLDEEGLEEVEKFRFWAKANTFAVDLISGKHGILSEYVQFLTDNPEEILPGLVTIMEAANQNDWNVDYILQQFSRDIESFATLEENNNQLYYFTLMFHMAVYYLKRANYTVALNCILDSLQTSSSIKRDSEFKVLAALFETFRVYASDEQQNAYRTILKGVLTDAKGKGFNLSRFGVCIS